MSTLNQLVEDSKVGQGDHVRLMCQGDMVCNAVAGIIENGQVYIFSFTQCNACSICSSILLQRLIVNKNVQVRIEGRNVSFKDSTFGEILILGENE